MVWRHRQSSRQIFDLQGLESPPFVWLDGHAHVSLVIDQDRLLSEIEALAAISDAEAPAVTRIVFTPTDLRARAWLESKCVDAGLTIRREAVGNMFARWTGTDSTAPAIGTGSHIDAIPNA